MLENLLGTNSVYYGMGVIVSCGIVSKLIVGGSLKRLEKSASNISKSTHKFMKLVRAKFEHAYMANNGVDNVEVFVDKYIREYKVAGLNLHTWQRLEKIALGATVIVGGAATVLTYSNTMNVPASLQYGIATIGSALIMLGSYQFVDEGYRITTIRIYMVDYLENVCASRYQKAQLKNRDMVEQSKNSQSEESYLVTKEIQNITEKSEASTAGVTVEEANMVRRAQVEKIQLSKMLDLDELAKGIDIQGGNNEINIQIAKPSVPMQEELEAKKISINKQKKPEYRIPTLEEEEVDYEQELFSLCSGLQKKEKKVGKGQEIEDKTPVFNEKGEEKLSAIHQLLLEEAKKKKEPISDQTPDASTTIIRDILQEYMA